MERIGRMERMERIGEDGEIRRGWKGTEPCIR